MTLNVKQKKVLLQFSQYLATLPSTSSASTTTEQRTQIVQKEWYDCKLFGLPNISRFTTKEIDASTGSSAFAPPGKVSSEITNIDASILPEYHNHLPQDDMVKLASKYFNQIGILDNNNSLKQNIYATEKTEDYFSVIGNGTTQIFTSALKSIIKTKGDVVIFTAPTYGLFLQPVYNLQGKIEILSLHAKNHFKPNAAELETLILETNTKLKQNYLKQLSAQTILLNAYFEQNPPNAQLKKNILNHKNKLSTLLKAKPDSNFEKLDATCKDFNLALSTLLSKKHDQVEAQNLHDRLKVSLCQRVRGYLHINPHMPLGTICSQPEVNKLAKALRGSPDVTVIDDLSYYDLVLPDAKVKPGTFAKSELKNKTLTLYSLSKQFALASARPGIGLGPKDLIEPIVKDVFDTINSPNLLTFNAFYSLFNLNKQERETFLTETNTEYAFRRDFTMALIQGLEKNTNKNTIKKIKQELTQFKVDNKEQSTLLKGIPGLTVRIKPDSGFFVIIDFSHYQNKYLGNVKLTQSRDFHNAFQCLGDVNTIPGEMMFEYDKPALRFSFSLTTKETLEGLLRIRKILALCTNKSLDLKEVKENKQTAGESRSVSKQLTLSVAKVKAPPPQSVKYAAPRSFTPQYKSRAKNAARYEPPHASLNRTKGKRKVTPTKPFGCK